MSKALGDDVAVESERALVAVASDTCLRLTSDEIKEGSAGLLVGPKGEGFWTVAFVADKSASYSRRRVS